MARLSNRQKLIAGSRSLLRRQGYHASSVSAITEEAGVAKGSFSNNFATKEEWAGEVLTLYWNDAEFVMPQVDESLPVLKVLTTHFELLAAGTREFGLSYGCLVGNLIAEVAHQSEALRVQLQQFLHRWSSAIEAVIEHGQTRSELTENVSPDVLARTLVAAWEGAVLRAKAELDDRPFQDFLICLPQMIGVKQSISLEPESSRPSK